MNKDEAKNELRNALTGAKGNFDIIVFHDARKSEIIIKALEELRIFWCEIDGEIYTNRHEINEVVR